MQAAETEVQLKYIYFKTIGLKGAIEWKTVFTLA